jgi:hypothetical protein
VVDCIGTISSSGSYQAALNPLDASERPSLDPMLVGPAAQTLGLSFWWERGTS